MYSRENLVKRTGFLGDLISWEDGVYLTSESIFLGGRVKTGHFVDGQNRPFPRR